jgi:hypothetical protein
MKAGLVSSDWEVRLQALRTLDLTSVQDYGDKGEPFHVRKVFAFQLAQGLGLVDGVEIYTKGEAAHQYPALRPYLYREDVTFEAMLPFFTRFLTVCERTDVSGYDLKTEKKL